MGVKLTPARARALQAAADGRLRQWKDAGGKTYAEGQGTVQRATIDALRGSQPPLLAEGAHTSMGVALVLTAAGKAALAEHRVGAIKHVGKARPR